MSDLDLDESSFRLSDVIEWCGEAVEKIGSVRQLKRKVTGVDTDSLEISGYQAQLPADLFRLNSVAYSTNPAGPWVPMTIETNVFGSNNVNTESSTGLTVNDETLIQLVEDIYKKQIENPIYAWFSKMDRTTAIALLNNDPNLRTILTNLINAADQNTLNMSSIGLKYSIKPGYVVTNVATGYLKLSYDAQYMDKDGYPMIPDLISYVEAVYWYVVMKLKYPDYLGGRLDRERYYDIRRSWNFYCKQAYGESMMPNHDEMETIKNTWTRLVPSMNEFDSFYENIGSPQLIKTSNRR